MPTEDSSPGLLSKVVKFVRNPATSWSDLDNKEVNRDEALSKQLLKEMIERKRQNDFVRKREFDMLRKLRKREAMVGMDPNARPSFFQSSLPSTPDERARTIKKIDAIEAQMSMQWWKTKQGGSSLNSLGGTTPSGATPVGDDLPPDSTPFVGNAVSAAYAATEPASLEQLVGKAARDLAAAQAAADDSPGLASARPASGAGLAGSDQNAGAGFMATHLLPMNGVDVAHDAELEEASIRFANGDDTGAEAGLIDMLADGDARIGHPDTWMALFDLYRATAQHDKFEITAIDFVRRFDRSAPQWFSMPDMVVQLNPQDAPASGNGPTAHWICPSVAGIQTVAALRAALGRFPMPWRLDWTNLKSLDPSAVGPLCAVFSEWSREPVKLRFTGSAQLQQVLENATPSGQRETPQACWLLRMEALRIMHRPDEFELAALDFCVTYELSPPAWDNALCDYKSLDAEGGLSTGHTFIGDVQRDSVVSSLSMDGDTQLDRLSSQVANVVSVELSGQIQGDVMAVLDRLEDKLVGADVMTISCAKLIRVDFSAAGALLNWVSARSMENRIVQFSDVNRLVAAFFNVIGITEYARVTLRVD